MHTVLARSPLVRWFISVITLAFVLAATPCCATTTTADGSRDADAFDPARVRGMWVTRWDYLTPDDVREIIANCARMGATDVFWQVRGQADAYYKSDLEPWGEELFRGREHVTAADLARGPGYDPLALAVREAHARGMRLHAWMNTMPLWKGKAAPRNPRHPYYTHAAWRLSDQHNKPQPLNDHYVIMNPASPAVHAHIAAVVRDLVSRYDVDGVHLDYIRFVDDGIDTKHLYPADTATRALYQAQTKQAFRDDEAGRAAYRAWVRERITELVRTIRVETDRANVALTAAVWRRPDLARGRYLQDAARWANEGAVDAVMPMIYTDSNTQYVSDLAAWHQAAGTRRVVPGVGAYKHADGARTLEQLDAGAGRSRWVLFAYSSYFDSRAPGQLYTPEARALREARRIVIERLARDGSS